MVSRGSNTTEALQRWANDPLAWTKTFWPDLRLSAKQRDILLSIRDCKETFVHTGHELGKTFVIALAILWFFCTRHPAKVIVTSSSEKQLLKALWPEVRRLIRTARYDLGVDDKKLWLDVLDADGKAYEDHFVSFGVASNPENFQGAHLPATDAKPRVLVIFDEASGERISEEFYDAGVSQAHRLVAIGNPLRARGWFYRECKTGDMEDPDEPGKLLKRVIHVDGKESPNVVIGELWRKRGLPGKPPTVIPGMLSYAAYVFRDRKWDEAKKKIRLHGHFYEGSDLCMFPPEWLNRSEEVWEELSGVRRGLYGLGVDVAEGGRDLTVWAVVDHLGLVRLRARRTPDTSIITTETKALMEEYSIPASRVAFDRGGGGKQHADRMRRQGVSVRYVGFGETARDSKAYHDRRAELYGRLREIANPSQWSLLPEEDGKPAQWVKCFALPPRDCDNIEGACELREELAVLPLQYDDKLRLQLMPKSPKPGRPADGTIQGLIGRSPDRADALVLAYWALTVPQEGAAPVVDHPIAYDVSEVEAAIEENEKAGAVMAALEEKWGL